MMLLMSQVHILVQEWFPLFQTVLGRLTELLLIILLAVCAEVILLLELSECAWFLSLGNNDALIWGAMML